MAEAMEQRRNKMWYALPIIGLAVPTAVTLIRRLSGGGMPTESKDEVLLDESNLDLQSALHKALKYVPGTPVEVELEEEHGIPVWEVQVVPKKGGPTREILIDAKTGDLLEMKAEFLSAD